MRRRHLLLVGLPVLGLVASLPGAAATSSSPEPFDAADLKIEVNATDGDAGLQVFLDHEAWKRVKILDPEGRLLADIQTKGRLRDYGLTELFSESSEPPFDEFPLSQFKELFPEGDYTFWGRTVDGTVLESTVPLTHDIPDGPEIVEPVDEATVARDSVHVRWNGVTTPAGIDITGYQVIVSRDDDARILSADLGPTARFLHVPLVFLQPGTDYNVEVLAIEASGNQTLTEVAFSVE
jgi:Fibronectin type III domain